MSDLLYLNADDRGVLMLCPQCRRANRIPFGRLHQTGRCGNCKASLPPPALPLEIASPSVFADLIRVSSLPVFVDFWAPWCGPCRMVAPEVANLASLVAGELLVVKVNTEAHPDIGARMGINSIPTFAVFAGGREVGRTAGAMPAAQLRAFALQAVAGTGAGS